MQRIQKVDAATAPQKTKDIFAAVKAQMGIVPNLVATMAHAPAAVSGYLGLAGALGDGALDRKLREQIAVAVAGANACDYCASAHTLLGKNAGVAAGEIARNLSGASNDARTAAALAFAVKIVRERGHVSDSDLAAVRAAGYSDEEIVEIVAHVAMNVFTNYFNHIAGTEVDFPLVATQQAAA